MQATALQNIGQQNTANLSALQTQNPQQNADEKKGFGNILDAAKISTQKMGQAGSQNTKAQVQSQISQSGKSDTSADKKVKADNIDQKNQTGQTNQAGQTNKTDQANQPDKTDQSKQVPDDKVTDDTTTDTGKVNDTDPVAEIKNAITEAGNQLVKDVAKELDLSEQDIQNAMQMLGLTAADLLNPQNLTQLVSNLTGEADSIGILTDGKLYQNLQDLLQTADELRSNISETFQLSQDQVQELINTVSKQEEPSDPVTMGNLVDNTVKQMPVAETNENQKLQQFDVLKTAQDGEVTQVKVTVDNQSGSRTEDTPEVVTLNEQLTQDNKGNSSENSFTDDSAAHTLLDQIVNSLGKTNNASALTPTGTFQEAATQSSTQTSDMQSVVNQITEYMKVQMKPDMTSMEMQLHPQSLGTVNVVVSAARDGTMVAQFTAQNETVKAAIESQVAQLQQRFDEQGIKVNAVEVTVQSHQFEQNLEQGAQQQQDTGNTRSRSGRSIRRINLGGVTSQDTDTEQMDDASRITAQMMAANGNTVDYTA